ncbi:hypothetical protein EON82_18500 [bacterium]|nr:MAG: hypothetical protein EON82_18500 [bacterium]
MKPKDDPQNAPLRRVLDQLSELCEHASLTGSHRGGEATAARAFNGVLASLLERGVVPPGMFDRVDEHSADFGSIGVQAQLLQAMIAEEEPSHRGEGLEAVVALAPFLDSRDLGALVRERMEGAQISDRVLTGLAPFLDSEALGDIVRRKIRRPEPPEAPAAPAPPTPAPAPTVDYRPMVAEAPHETLESLADQLRRPDLSMEDRQRIAMRLAELSYEQSVQAID